tara:strand:- start:1625 stop:2782 length:1158 start_codon:yes stop_codon:yes gene_type:complete
MALTTVPVELASLDGAVTVNESSADADFRVESNGDTHRLFIDGGNDRVLIGTTASRTMSGVTSDFFIEGTAYGDSSIGMAINANGANDCPALFFGKSRGTSLGSNTIVQNGDRLFSMRIDGSDGTNLEQAAVIEVHVDAAPGANEIPGRITFMTTTDGSQYATEKMRIDNAGDVSVAANATGAARVKGVSGDQDDRNAGGYPQYTFVGNEGTGMRRVAANTLALDAGGEEALRIDGSGHVTMPLQSAFQFRKSAQQANITTGSNVDVTWDTQIIDKNSDFDATNNRFVAPVTGTYFLNTQIRFDNQDSAASYYQLHITTSNRDYSLTIDPEGFDSNNTYWTESVSVVADMDASDTAKVQVRQQGGSAQTDIDYGGSSWFSGHLLS